MKNDNQIVTYTKNVISDKWEFMILDMESN